MPPVTTLKRAVVALLGRDRVNRLTAPFMTIWRAVGPGVSSMHCQAAVCS